MLYATFRAYRDTAVSSTEVGPPDHLLDIADSHRNLSPNCDRLIDGPALGLRIPRDASLDRTFPKFHCATRAHAFLSLSLSLMIVHLKSVRLLSSRYTRSSRTQSSVRSAVRADISLPRSSRRSLFTNANRNNFCAPSISYLSLSLSLSPSSKRIHQQSRSSAVALLSELMTNRSSLIADGMNSTWHESIGFGEDLNGWLTGWLAEGSTFSGITASHRVRSRDDGRSDTARSAAGVPDIPDKVVEIPVSHRPPSAVLRVQPLTLI